MISLIRPENVPSRGVAERIGMSIWKETAFFLILFLAIIWLREPFSDELGDDARVLLGFRPQPRENKTQARQRHP